MPFSPAQLEAIQIRNKNVIVSASAGSGKTSVLVQRLSTLVIQDRISIDSIISGKWMCCKRIFVIHIQNDETIRRISA